MFQEAVTVAKVDGVSISTVLGETDELMQAARIARVLVENEWAKRQS